jgi:hypothetical protein
MTRRDLIKGLACEWCNGTGRVDGESCGLCGTGDNVPRGKLNINGKVVENPSRASVAEVLNRFMQSTGWPNA